METSTRNEYHPVYDQLMGEGFLESVVLTIAQQCRAHLDKPSAFMDPDIRVRSRGTDRWNGVDDSCISMGDRYGFSKVAIDLQGPGKGTKMFVIARKDLIVSFHKTRSPGQVATSANYIRNILHTSENRLLYAAGEREDHQAVQALNLGLLVQVTYGFKRSNRLKEKPDWIIFGIPDGTTMKFYFERDLLEDFPHLRNDESQINLNIDAPRRTFSPRTPTPPAKRVEGEDS